MPTRQKIEVYAFRRTKREVEYLLLKRVPKGGGYWQPITGSVEQDETTKAAALRETCEEIGTCSDGNLYGPVYRFRFEKGGVEFEEHVFGLEIGEARIVISSEHSDWKWCGYEEALADLRWEVNREGLRRLRAELEREG
jgi:8-oxo-dGTP pyrophosphatase MutT (NUDIX family)